MTNDEQLQDPDARGDETQEEFATEVRPPEEAGEANSPPPTPEKRQGPLLVLVVVIALALAAAGIALLIAKRMGQTSQEVTTASGLKYTDLKVGTGATPQTGQIVTVHYIGTLTDGKKFESSFDRGAAADFRIGVGQLIKGWEEGIMTMKVGGKRRMIIPANLAYGPTGRPPKIPGNATLIFEVDLLDVKTEPEKTFIY
jgi:peptidylprolyl isomerase